MESVHVFSREDDVPHKCQKNEGREGKEKKGFVARRIREGKKLYDRQMTTDH
jgi:hypothetical protein